MEDKCKRCLLRQPVISENGMHYNCRLSDKKWHECLHGIKDHSAKLNIMDLKEGERS